MSNILADRKAQVLALEPRLLAQAASMTRGEPEARALVSATLAHAEAVGYGPPGEAPEGWLFRLLRQEFYSVERDRNYRRSRSAEVSELLNARRRTLWEQATAEAVGVV